MPQEKKRRDYFIALFVAVFFLCLYLFCLNDNLSHAHDASDYYGRILSQPQWHGNHLIYEFAARFWLDFWRDIIPDSISSIRIIASLNSVFGAALTGILFLYCRKVLSFSIAYSLVTIGMIGFSFYFVTYSATVEIYMPVLCLSFLALLCARSMTIMISSALLIGFIHGVAMLWHQMAFLFGFVILLAFWDYKKEGFFYLLAGSFVVLSGYGFAAWDLNIDNMTDLSKLFSGYLTSEDVLSDRKNSPFYLSVFGLGMALLGGRLLMALEPFKSLIETYFATHSFQRLIYLHHQTSGLDTIIQLVAYGVFVLCLVYIIYHYCRTKKSSKFVVDLWVLLIIHSAFFIFWFPHNPEFWAVQIICCIGILMQSKPNMIISFLAFIAITVINIMGTVLPLKNLQNDLYYHSDILFLDQV